MPKQHVTVRPAGLEDFDEVFALTEAVAAEGRWLGTEAPVDRERRQRGFESYVERDDAVNFVAELDGRIVGSLFIEVLGYGVAELGMMVADGMRGRGIGSDLLTAALEFARDAD